MNPSTNHFWHEKFKQNDYVYGTQANDFLTEYHHYLPKNGRILSLGEGEGRNAVYLAGLGYQVTALDAAQSGLDKVQRLAESQNVEVKTILTDLAHYEFEPNQWDGIISIFCHLPPTLRQQVHQQIPLALKTNGVFLLEAYAPKQLDFKTGGPSALEMLYTAADLATELTPLQFERLVELERNIHEGQAHHGTSAVVQIVARRLSQTIEKA